MDLCTVKRLEDRHHFGRSRWYFTDIALLYVALNFGPIHEHCACAFTRVEEYAKSRQMACIFAQGVVGTGWSIPI